MTAEKPKTPWPKPEPTEAELIERAMRLFRGSSTHHGTYTLLGEVRPDGKVKTKGATLTGGATAELWRGHLGDGDPLGVSPVQDDGMCGWGAIDRDEYALNHAAIATEIEELGLPLTVVKSKSSGAHLLAGVFEDDIPAALMQEALAFMRDLLGLAKGIEIYPKQTEHKGPKSTNWLNMPYRHGTDTVCVRPDGTELSFPEFIHRFEGRRRGKAWYEKFVKEARAEAKAKAKAARKDDAPGEAPRGGGGGGEARLEFWRLQMHKPDEKTFRETMNEKARFEVHANSQLTAAAYDLARFCRHDGLSPDRARSVIYGEWLYRKTDEPQTEADESFEDVWQRQYEKGWAEGAPIFGGLPVYDQVFVTEDGDDTTFRLVVGGKTIPAIKARDWLDQKKFNALALIYLEDTYPELAWKDRGKWRLHVTEARARAEPDPLVANISRGDTFVELLNDFIHNTQRSASRDDILLKRAWLDDEAEDPAYYFRLGDLQNFIRDANTPEFGKPKRPEIAARIRKLGGSDLALKLMGDSVRCFWVPRSAVGGPAEPIDTPPPPTREV